MKKIESTSLLQADCFFDHEPPYDNNDISNVLENNYYSSKDFTFYGSTCPLYRTRTLRCSMGFYNEAFL